MYEIVESKPHGLQKERRAIINERPIYNKYKRNEKIIPDIENYYKRLTARYDREKDMVKLKSEGKTFQQIADKYNLSRQRVHQIVCKH